MSCITNALEMQTLLIELKEYEDVFLTENADKLSESCLNDTINEDQSW